MDVKHLIQYLVIVVPMLVRAVHFINETPYLGTLKISNTFSLSNKAQESTLQRKFCIENLNVQVQIPNLDASKKIN